MVEIKNAIIEPNKRFFIITGSFGNEKNAIKLLNTLKNKGFKKAEIIYPKRRNEKLIKVSAGGFENESEADEQARKVEDVLNQTTWIYNK